MSADEALARENGNKGHSTALDEAVAWLSDALADGPRPGKEVKDAAKADGISLRTLDRAKVKLGVIAGPDGFGGAWMWSLPDSDRVRQDFPECAKENTLAQCGESGALCDGEPPAEGEMEDDGTVPF